MVYTNLKEISLQKEMDINPSIRDVFAYTNTKWPCSNVIFLDNLDKAKKRIVADEQLLIKIHPKMTFALSLPIYRATPELLTFLNKEFSSIDSEYRAFGNTMPAVTLEVIGGIVCGNMTSAQWQDRRDTLLNKFTDLKYLWKKEIHTSCMPIVDIVRNINVYYRRAEFLSMQNRVYHELEGQSAAAIQAAMLRNPEISEHYKSHLSEKALFLDAPYGNALIQGNASDLTDMFGKSE